MKFGEYLKLIRNKRNLKLTKAAEMMGISSSYLSSLESGGRPAPSFKVLHKIADVLQLKPQERHQLYDLAAESKMPPTLADDLNTYIYQIPKLRGMLRNSMECGLTEKDWDVVLNFMKKNYLY